MSELSKLPLISAPAAPLQAAQIAIARAVASGQSADQLAADLGALAGWQGINTSQAPAGFQSGPTASNLTAAKPSATSPPVPPAWIGAIVPIALAKDVSTRVAILDREPTALGGMERPAWARALAPAATYGPISVSSASYQIVAEKWIQVFNFTETVEFVRSGSVLCVLPLSIFHFGSPTQAGILAGSAWIAAQPFASAAPADGFAGIAIQSGELTSDQALTFTSTTVTVPATASLSLTLVPALPPGGPAGFPATISAPGKISVSFPATGSATISFDSCAATIYGQAITATPINSPATYNSQLQLLYIPGQSSQPAFAPAHAAGKLLTLTGSATIPNAGWALSISESSTPATLGTAANSGDFAFVLGAGLSSQWTGLARSEPAAFGALIATNSSIVLYLFSGTAPGVQLNQSFQLWDDQDTNNTRRCQLIATRTAGQLLLYGLVGTEEVLELGASLAALVDRPLLATGARVPAAFLEGVVALIQNNSGHRLYAYSAAPASPPTLTGKPAVYPMALDNGLLDVSAPQALFVYARTDANFNSTEGLLYLLFAYLLVELYLPDPYTGGLQAGVGQGSPGTFATGQTPATESVLYGFIIAEVVWPTIATAQLRISDTAHSHPAAPPSTEAGSTAVPHMAYGPPHEILPGPIELATTTVSAPAALAPQAAVPPPVTGPPLPEPLAGALFLDLSTRASQLGVEVTVHDRADVQYTIDGLSVRGPASLLPLATLPAIAWEPMYNTSTAVDPTVSDYTLLHPPNDGPVCQVRPTSATLIPISPLQSLQAVLDAGTGGFTAQLTLPFGMIGVLSDSATVSGTLLPNLTLVQPTFPASVTPSGTLYTGAWQISFSAPDPNDPDPIFAGATYLRTQDDNPPSPTLSYGEQVLGGNVTSIFDSRFNPPSPSPTATPGVPLRRYDLTGYGASTFSEWTNTTPYVTDVIKAFFHVLVGRTSHEVIQVQSIVYPWAIKVVRTITIDRQGSGVVQRYDSGWQAASDGLFQYPAAAEINPDSIHPGVIGGVINVRNIQQLGPEVTTQGTEDSATTSGPVTMQPVTFDADVIIQPQHQVLQGGASLQDLTGQTHVCLPSTGITGFVGLTTGFHLSVSDMVNFDALSNGAGGPISATLNVGGANSLLRATQFDATPIVDATIMSRAVALVGDVRGIPKLSSDGSWSVASRTQSQTAPVPLPRTQPVPLVQPNVSGSSTIGNLIHFADPSDLFRLDPGSTTPPDTLYGFLQATGTQSNFLSRPILTVGSQQLTLGDALNVAHAGALLGAISSFPDISNCLQFLSSALAPITNQLSAPSLSTTQNLYLPSSYNTSSFPLISTSIADVNLYFHWNGGSLPAAPDPGTVVIALGQTTGPSWSLDINQVAIGLVIPAIDSQPIMWLQGGFHADADTLPPAFPNLQVVFSGPMQPLTQFFTLLQSLQSVLTPGGGAGAELRHAHIAQAHDDSSDSPGLNVHFSDGKLAVSDNFTLPDIPLGPGTISDVSLDIGTTLDIIGLSIDFLVGIGSPDTPCHWIVDPLSGTFCLQAGIQSNQLDILIQAGIGLGLALDLGIASGSASIVIAVQIQVQGSTVTLMFLLTGQAEVDVLGGLASAAITLTAGLGLSFNLSDPLDANLIGTAAVGIHISICWVVNISWSGSWTFQKEINLAQLT
ncbi:MAG: hypothetical protein WBD06_19735 [Acidobacteriaceae bacterium]